MHRGYVLIKHCFHIQNAMKVGNLTDGPWMCNTEDFVKQMDVCVVVVVVAVVVIVVVAAVAVAVVLVLVLVLVVVVVVVIVWLSCCCCCYCVLLLCSLVCGLLLAVSAHACPGRETETER